MTRKTAIGAILGLSMFAAAAAQPAAAAGARADRVSAARRGVLPPAVAAGVLDAAVLLVMLAAAIVRRHEPAYPGTSVVINRTGLKAKSRTQIPSLSRGSSEASTIWTL